MNWLRSHHRVGQFNRRDQWGQVSLTRLDEIVLYKMRILELEEDSRTRDSRYEEQAFLHSVFSTNPSSKDIFLKMFPRYNQEGEESIDFFTPQNPEDVQDLLADVREMGLFQDTK